MAVDYLSALNVGSGLNVTQIVDALIDAERAPQEATLTAKVEEKTVSISTFAQAKQEFSGFSENLSLLSSFTGLVVQSSGSSVYPTVSDNSKVVPSEHVMEVSQLAKPQTLAFTGYTSETAVIDASAITLDLGTWNSDGSYTSGSTNALTFDPGATLTDVRDAINELDIGVTATILRTSDNNYALTLRAPMGLENQMRLQTTPIAPAVSSLLNFDPSAADRAGNSGDAIKEAIAAQDAIFTIDGLSVTRPSNVVDDVIAGVSLELTAVSVGPETISARYDEDMTLEAVQLFVDELNTLTNSLNEMNKTGLDDETSGPLAGDTLIRAYRNQLRMITTTPIAGYGDEDIFLSNFGVMTNRDGTLSLDEAKFRSYFQNKPDAFAALANTRTSTDSLSVQATMTGNLYTPGVYDFVKNADGTATLDGEAMSLENGVYKITTGAARGIQITASSATANAKVYVGKSLFDSLISFTETILKTNSDIDQKVARYNNDVTKYNEQLADLDERMIAQRALYVERFSAMETAVSSFKETSTLLDNFMESWRASLK